MLRLNCSNKVTFKVHVSGTASTPKVRCVIGESPALCFDAVKLQNDEFEADIILPASFNAGAYPFKIEVFLNGRVFTPIQNSVSVLEGPVQQPAPVIAPVDVPVDAPVDPLYAPSENAPGSKTQKSNIDLLQLVSKLVEPAKTAPQQVSENTPKPKAATPASTKNVKINLPKFEAKCVTPISVSDLIKSKPATISRLQEVVNQDVVKLPPRKVTQAAVLTEDAPVLVQGEIIYL